MTLSPSQLATWRAYSIGPTEDLERRRDVLRSWLADVAAKPAAHRTPDFVRLLVRAVNRLELELERRERGMAATIDPGPAVPADVLLLLDTDAGLCWLFGTTAADHARDQPSAATRGLTLIRRMADGAA